VINIENKKNKYFFTTGGVVDFKNNSLSILCQEVYDIEDLSDTKISELKKRAKDSADDPNSGDHDQFISNAMIEELNLLQSK